MLGRRVLKKPSLLLDRSELGVALINDQVLHRVPDALVRDLNHLLPLRATLKGAKFDFVRAGRAELGLEFVVYDFRLSHSDVFLPDTESVHQVGKSRTAH